MPNEGPTADTRPAPDAAPAPLTVVVGQYEQTADIGKLAGALAVAQGEIRSAIKDARNPHLGVMYADLAAIWDACRGPLSKNGLAVFQPVMSDGESIKIKTILAHSSGQWVSAIFAVKSGGAGYEKANEKTMPIQRMGAAITYARRYGLSSMIGITSDEEDDGAGVAQPATQTQRHTPPATPANPGRTQCITLVRQWTGLKAIETAEIGSMLRKSADRAGLPKLAEGASYTPEQYGKVAAWISQQIEAGVDWMKI
jgi:hypothetical protein